MPAPTYKFSEFVDALLVRLYELDQSKSDEFFGLREVLSTVKGDVPTSWTFDAAKVLQARGLAECLFNSKGVQSHISGEGRLFVEERKGFTKKIQEDPAAYYITVSGNNNQLMAGQQGGQATQSVSTIQAPGTAAELAAAIERTIKEDASLGTEERDDALSFAVVARRELRKEEPDRTVLAVVLEKLSQVLSVAGQVANLIKMVNG